MDVSIFNMVLLPFFTCAFYKRKIPSNSMMSNTKKTHRTKLLEELLRSERLQSHHSEKHFFSVISLGGLSAPVFQRANPWDR